MFNWYSAPTFVGMLLFWLLATYVLTRVPLSPVSIATISTEVATAAYFLGQAMQANASTLEEWWPWARHLQWSAAVAPALWYWVTALLLREQDAAPIETYLRRVGYPVGLLFAVACLVLAVSIYVDDWLYLWSAPISLSPERGAFSRWHAPAGVLYPAFVAFLSATTLGAAANVWQGWRLARDGEERRRFAWLLLTAVLFIPGVGSLAVANWLALEYWPAWLSHLAISAAMALMASNVAAYSLLFRGYVIHADLPYFLTAMGVLCIIYALVFLSAGPAYSFPLLELLAIILILAILSHALADVARRVFDRLFFGSEVRRLRSNLSAVVQDAALAEDLGPVLEQAQTQIAEVSAERLVRLTEEALRRLSSPAALAQCQLIARIPRTLAATRSVQSDSKPPEGTPLEQAQALRQVLTQAIERLKPPDEQAGLGAPPALQYHILREEYLLGMPNKHIMVRHSISEGTFHRNRRRAIEVLAQEVAKNEDLLSQQQS
jgi:hypothetical protein